MLAPIQGNHAPRKIARAPENTGIERRQGAWTAAWGDLSARAKPRDIVQSRRLTVKSNWDFVHASH
jgi:hypothetical protein